MGLVIEGMKMPRSCWECDLHCFRDNGFRDKEKIQWGSPTIIPEDFRCGGNNVWHESDEFDFLNERHPDCPIVEIPTPHGRLIDADELEKCVHEWYDVGEYVFADTIRNADTIIEAEV